MSSLGNKEIMAQNIQYYMDLHGKTRNDMCKALGVKYTTFTDWVKGKTYPRIDKIELMANYFGINKSDLVEPRGQKDPADPDGILSDYNALSDKSKETVRNVIHALKETEK